MKYSIHKKILLWFTIAFLAVLVLLLAWREYLIVHLPFEDWKIPSAIEERLEIPPRPGIQGIVITGPEILPLKFSILSNPGAMFLNWNALMRVDPNTDVKVTARIDAHGRLVFSQADILMEGHTEAGLMIQRALKTWMYRPYKLGTIRFWFNLPSKGKKLIIDTSGLVRNEGIPSYVPIYTGRLYLIDGIPFNEVQTGKYF